MESGATPGSSASGQRHLSPTLRSQARPLEEEEEDGCVALAECRKQHQARGGHPFRAASRLPVARPAA